MGLVFSGMMNFDLSPVLADWEYEPGKVMVRRFTGEDGVDKLQLRVDLGILQMSVEGRPDGKRPHGRESLFEYHKERIHDGNIEDFSLSDEEVSALQQEAIQYYHRYICFFELNDHEGVVRDTERNLEVFDFIESFAISDEALNVLVNLRPQLVMMNVRSRSALLMDSERFDEALHVVQEGIEDIEDLFDEDSSDVLDNLAELRFLRNLESEVAARRPLSERERLENALNAAVEREDYEMAAQMRDAIFRLEGRAP